MAAAHHGPALAALSSRPPGSVPVVVIAGPTAAGKSAVAMAVAAARPAVIVNADSMQIYGELPVLTARPTPRDQAWVPHRLYGVVPAAAGFSAAAWRDRALAAIDEAVAVGRQPILVGGTGLYLKALIDGLSPIPRVPAAVRADAMALLRRDGATGLHRRLASADPAMAARLDPGDSQRLVRAWEVLAATGRSLAAWQAASPVGPPACLAFTGIVVMPPRAALRTACHRRMRAMVADGAVDEVARLLALGLAPDRPAMKALGVPAFADFLAGRVTCAEAIRRAVTATRQYAKRQVTWFRHQSPGSARRVAQWHVIEEQYSESLCGKIVMMVRDLG